MEHVQNMDPEQELSLRSLLDQFIPTPSGCSFRVQNKQLMEHVQNMDPEQELSFLS